MHSRYAMVVIGVSVVACSDPPETVEPEAVVAPATTAPQLSPTEQSLARLEQRRQSIINAEMDEETRIRFLSTIARQEEDIRTCLSRGGRLVALAGVASCYEAYTDGGKICSDSSECEGACVVEEPLTVESGVATTGMCQPEEPVSSCYATITNGIAGLTICIN